MKKILVYGLSVLLVVILVLFASRLVGCGNSLQGSTNTNTQTGSSTTISLATLPTIPIAHEFLFVSCGSSEISVYSVEATGDLTKTQDLYAPTPSGIIPGTLQGMNPIIHPSGYFLYLQPQLAGWALGDSTHIVIYGVDTNQGLLSLKNGNATVPFISPPPYQFTLDPAGKYAYTPNEFFDSSQGSVKIINGYDISSIGLDGELTLEQTDEIASITGSQTANKLLFHSSGHYAYIISNAMGTNITPMTGTSIEVTPCLVAGDGTITTQPIVFAETVAINEKVNAAIDPIGKNLFILKQKTNQLLWFAIDQSTGLPASSPEVFALSASPIDIALHPSCRMAYVLAGSSIYIYSIDPIANNVVGYISKVDLPVKKLGGLIPVSDFTSIVADASGQFLFVMDSGGEEILSYKIGATGDLTKTANNISTGKYPKYMVIWGK
jgi:6-phosphogluconolactonase (cycloisomerase 2 family)